MKSGVNLPGLSVPGCASASPTRAREIAGLEQLALPEFTELTGVGVGEFSIYRVSETGVSLRMSEDLKLGDLSVEGQVAYHHAKGRLTLEFPCTPARLVEWHDATRGEPPKSQPKQPAERGVSDFPLAPAFEAEVRRRGGYTPSRFSCASGDIVKAFAVKPSAAENGMWWDARLRDPERYGLSSARAMKGKAGRPSRWYPDIIAVWLIDKKHMPRDAVERALGKHFPDVDADLI